ncbi:MAG TPA: hypothetical protein VFS44_02570 [Gemmatimonadaceae bacterium]|nr:hypothetical protein [Gemmatimonadaceae bacterium]
MRIVVVTEEHRERVPVRHVTRLLSGLLTVYAGVVIAAEPERGDEVIASLAAGAREVEGGLAADRGGGYGLDLYPGPGGERPRVDEALMRALELAGAALLQGDAWHPASPRLESLVSGSLERRWTEGDSLEVGRLATGSVYTDIEIARDLERVRERFAHIIRKVGSLLPWRGSERVREVRDAVRDVVEPGPRALAGAGVIGVGVQQVAAAAEGLGGTGVAVE